MEKFSVFVVISSLLISSVLAGVTIPNDANLQSNVDPNCQSITCISQCSLKGWNNWPCHQCLKCWGWLMSAMSSNNELSNPPLFVVLNSSKNQAGIPQTGELMQSPSAPAMQALPENFADIVDLRSSNRKIQQFPDNNPQAEFVPSSEFGNNPQTFALPQRLVYNVGPGNPLQPAVGIPISFANAAPYQIRPGAEFYGASNVDLRQQRPIHQNHLNPPNFYFPQGFKPMPKIPAQHTLEPYGMPVKSSKCGPVPSSCTQDPNLSCKMIIDQQECTVCSCIPNANFEVHAVTKTASGCSTIPETCTADPGEVCSLIKEINGCYVCRCRHKGKIFEDECFPVPDTCVQDPGEICTLQTDNRGCKFCKCRPKTFPGIIYASKNGKLHVSCPEVEKACDDFDKPNCVADVDDQGCITCKCAKNVSNTRPCATVMCAPYCTVVEGPDGCSRCSCPPRQNCNETDCESRNCTSIIGEFGCKRCDCFPVIPVCPEIKCNLDNGCYHVANNSGCATECVCPNETNSTAQEDDKRCPSVIHKCEDGMTRVCQENSESGCMSCKCETLSTDESANTRRPEIEVSSSEFYNTTSAEFTLTHNESSTEQPESETTTSQLEPVNNTTTNEFKNESTTNEMTTSESFYETTTANEITPCPLIKKCACNLTLTKGCLICPCESEQEIDAISCSNITCSENCTVHKDNVGCDICVCNNLVFYSETKCPELICEANCTLSRDINNCHACNCSNNSHEEFPKLCPALSCPKSCNLDLENGCPVCLCKSEPLKFECPQVRCSEGCTTKRDSRGCSVCECEDSGMP